MRSIERFVDYEAASSVDYYFLPYLHDKEFKESFITSQALFSKSAKGDSIDLPGMYLSDKGLASVWHLNMLIKERT